MIDTEPTLEELVTFCILMENHEGIVGKAPYYIMEKWRMKSARKGILDSNNQYKYDEYMSRWHSHISHEEG